MLGFPPSDNEFYERKIKTLSEENTILYGENTHLRKRLREAEEYQIRYELLLKNSQNQILRLKNHHEKEKILQKEELISSFFNQRQNKFKKQLVQLEEKLKEQAQIQLARLRNELSLANEKVREFESQSEQMELYGFKMKKYEKQNEELNQRLQEMKTYHEKQKQQEIASIKKHLTTSFKEKMTIQKKFYVEKIDELERRINQLEIKKDNQEFQVPKINTNDVLDLKKLFEQKRSNYENELRQLGESLEKKNEDIKKLLTEKAETEKNHRNELGQKRQLIKQLEDRLIQKEKENQQELFNMIQRVNATKELQLAQLKDQISKLKDELDREHSLWNERVMNHNRQIDNITRRYEDEKRKYGDEKNQHKRKISELSIRVKQAQGDRQIGDTQMLINSIKQMDIKEDQLGGYENGIVFLERQLKKCQIKLEERSRTINKLYKDMNDFRAEADAQLNEIKEKAKYDKKQYTDRIVTLENELKGLYDKLRIKEREDKRRQRESLKEKTQLEEQNAALKDLLEQIQRDYNRVVEGKKGAEASYRQQREKGISSKSDANTIKKMKWLELQKQKNALHVIFRDKEEQLRLHHQQEVDQKRNLIDRLKQDLQITQKENQLLKVENDKLLQEVHANKQNNKLSEYNKKISSLNLQIALTQNIYESLLKAKSNRPGEEQLAHSFGHIDYKSQSHENEEDRRELLMSFHPQAGKTKKGGK